LEGCESAARFLFSKDAAELSINEACFIASLLARPLPKRVFEVVEVEKHFREITPSYVLRIGELERLSWAKNVKRRYLYCCRMFPSIPNSLRIR
jgi:membrane carboxypeptidase/penicillin-binding protein PbpC